MKPRKVALIGAGGIAIAALVAALIPTWIESAAPVPPSNASARTIASAFLHAAERRDCPMMRALSDPDDTRWCVSWLRNALGDDPRLLSHGRLEVVPGSGADETDFTVMITVRGVSGMEDGTDAWGLLLRPTSAGWRVSDEGTG
jgi:hypothetical protein